MKFSSARFVALLVTALFAVGAFAGVSSAAASDSEAASATTFKKKKAKKCKKGYTKKTTKKKGKKTTKCVKKKAKKEAATSETVKSVTLGEPDTRLSFVKLPVTITLKKYVPTVKVAVFAQRGTKTIDGNIDVAIPEGALEHSTTLSVNTRPLLLDRRLKNQPISFWVTADGVKSNVR